MDELRQSDLEREFPAWKFWRGVNGLRYAQRRRRSPPVVLRAPDLGAALVALTHWRGRLRYWIWGLARPVGTAVPGGPAAYSRRTASSGASIP